MLLIEQLRESIAGCRQRPTDRPSRILPTGVAGLDRLLPAGGVETGTLIEILEPGPGSGGRTLAALLCRALGGRLVVFDRTRTFYPPAAFAWGWEPGRLAVLDAADDAAETWAAVQALRCTAVGAVWLARDRLAIADARRLRLAAEEGGAVGVLFRPERDRGQPSWADVQLIVRPRPAGLSIEMTRCRGGFPRSPITLALNTITDHETPRLSAPAALADPAPLRRASGAAPRAARRSRARRTAW